MWSNSIVYRLVRPICNGSWCEIVTSLWNMHNVPLSTLFDLVGRSLANCEKNQPSLETRALLSSARCGRLAPLSWCHSSWIHGFCWTSSSPPPHPHLLIFHHSLLPLGFLVHHFLLIGIGSETIATIKQATSAFCSHKLFVLWCGLICFTNYYLYHWNQMTSLRACLELLHQLQYRIALIKKDGVPTV